MIKFVGLFILLGLFSAFCGKNFEASAAFGEKVKYSQNVPLKFEDFTLVYTGERRVSSDKFPNGFLYQDFKAGTEKDEKTISWSSGTGDIAPTGFEIGGKNYELELKNSDKLGKLADGELVIWKK